MIPSRTVVQIRTHAQKYFQKQLKDGGSISRNVSTAAGSSYDEPSKIKRAKASIASSSGSNSRRREHSPAPPPASYQLPMPPPSLDSYRNAPPSTNSADFFSGATPRTVAAATILMVPSRGGNNPPWLEKNLVAQMRYLDTITSNGGAGAAASGTQGVVPPPLPQYEAPHWPVIHDDPHHPHQFLPSGGSSTSSELDAWSASLQQEMSPPPPSHMLSGPHMVGSSAAAATSLHDDIVMPTSTTPTLHGGGGGHADESEIGLEGLRTPPMMPE